MIKYIISLIFCLFTTQVLAYNEQDYQKLISGQKDLSGANLQEANIEYIDLTGVDFTRANLSNAQFTNVILTNVKFDNSILYHSEFNDSVFKDSSFDKTNASYAIFVGTTFDSVTIKDSIFDFARMQNTDFLNSKILNTSMCDMGSNLGDAKKIGFIACQLDGINFSRSTIQCLLMYDTDEIGENLNFGSTHFNNGCFLGRSQKSTLVKSNFEGSSFNECLFLNIDFSGCNGFAKMGVSISMFSNVKFTDQSDYANLKKCGAKVNGDYGGAGDGIAGDIFWNANTDSNFFVNLLVHAGLGVVTVVSSEAAKIYLAPYVAAACSIQ